MSYIVECTKNKYNLGRAHLIKCQGIWRNNNMKNKTVNKKVLRALSIGLAAMMTVQPILATPVFADDTEPVDDSNTTTYDEEKHESETTDEAREAVDTASNSADTVVEDVEAIKTDIPVIDQATGEVLNQANLV